MRKFSEFALCLVLLAGLAPPAAAQNLDLDELAAALALPIVTGGQAGNPIKNTTGDVVIPNPTAITLATVTNARTSPLLLRVDAISGDPATPLVGGDTWQSDSFDCLLTGRETTTFLIVPAGAGSIIYVECSTPFATDGPFADNRIIGAKAANGILWVAAADPSSGASISQDVMFGDAVVVDVVGGQAYSFGAVPFQAGQGANDGNKIYRFDGNEYARWPNVLATNFIAPSATAQQAGVRAELILFTLDGTAGNPTVPRVAVGGLAFDDDENSFDFQHEFDCFDIVALDDISLNFRQAFLGSISGHLQLVPQPVGTGNDVHDAAYGDGNDSRRRPVHGWLVQSLTPGGAAVLPGQPHAGQPNAFVSPDAAAWGRPLVQGRAAILPFLNDEDPTLDVDPLL